MSRIGNKAVEIPDKVKVNIGNDGAVAVEGPKGKLQWTLPREIKASVKDNRVSLVRDAETRSVKALHGLSRSLVHNMVQGVSEGFSKSLEIEGVAILGHLGRPSGGRFRRWNCGAGAGIDRSDPPAGDNAFPR